MGEQISVAGVQFLHEQGQRDFNLARAAEMIRATPGHDLYVLSELATSGYGPQAFARLDELSEKSDGPSYQFFSTLAREQQCFICYSFPRKTEQGKPTISAAVVDRDGKLLTVYDKWHVCQFGDCSEKDYFALGNSPLGTFEVDGFKVGIGICYDIRFPELIRKLTIEEGIDLLVHPGGWPRDEGFSTWHSFVTTRAIENSIYIMSPNRASSQNGGTIFCPPFVDFQDHKPSTLADWDAEGVLVGLVERARLEEVRATYTFLADRRAERY